MDMAFGMAQADPAADQGAGTVGLGAGFAQGRAPLGAWQAVAATGHEDHHHMVALLEILDPRTEGFDSARRFMAQGHGHRPWPVTVDDRQVRMAEPRRADAHQHLPGPGRCQLQGFDGHGPADGIGWRGIHMADNGGSDLHGVGSGGSAQ
ncbi:hypothetical protein D3C80_790820 [compost metagenome]